jgi:hypothetical protein
MLLLGLTSQYSVSSDEDEIILSPSKNIARRSLTNKTIVLDMDLTLICTIGDGSDISQRIRTNYREAYDLLRKKGVIVPTTLTQFGGSGKAMHNDVVKRPGVEEFLAFCRTVFRRVILWSAGQASYVYDTVRLVLDSSERGLFDHIYTAQDIVHRDIEEENGPFAEHLRRSGFTNFSTKPIEKISEKFPEVTLERTIIVDDLPCNFMPNPRNGILIPPFSPQLAQIVANATASQLDNMSGDHCLFSLLHFLADDAFLQSPDVRTYNLNFFPDPPSRKRQ